MIRFIIAAFLILCGLLIYTVSMVGMAKLKYVLNRIHVAGLCDTVGLLLLMSGLTVLAGFSFVTLKLILILACLWLTNPLTAHALAKAEIMTNTNNIHYKVMGDGGKDVQ